jgi:hypothetical protein
MLRPGSENGITIFFAAIAIRQTCHTQSRRRRMKSNDRKMKQTMSVCLPSSTSLHTEQHTTSPPITPSFAERTATLIHIASLSIPQGPGPAFIVPAVLQFRPQRSSIPNPEIVRATTTRCIPNQRYINLARGHIEAFAAKAGSPSPVVSDLNGSPAMPRLALLARWADEEGGSGDRT